MVYSRFIGGSGVENVFVIFTFTSIVCCSCHFLSITVINYLKFYGRSSFTRIDTNAHIDILNYRIAGKSGPHKIKMEII